MGSGRNTGLGGGGGGGGGGGFDGVGDGEEEEEEGFDGNKVVPMLGSPEVGQWLDALLKQLAEYELFVKWLVFRRLLQFWGITGARHREMASFLVNVSEWGIQAGAVVVPTLDRQGDGHSCRYEA